MWRFRVAVMTPKSIRTTKVILPSNSRVTCRTDPRWSRAVNPHRLRSTGHPRETKYRNTQRQKVLASTDRARFPPLSPPFSLVCPIGLRQGVDADMLYFCRGFFRNTLRCCRHHLPFQPHDRLQQRSRPATQGCDCLKASTHGCGLIWYFRWPDVIIAPDAVRRLRVRVRL